MKLIDSDKLESDINEYLKGNERFLHYLHVQDEVVVDARVSGKWVVDWDDGIILRCSNCGYENIFDWSYRYCPHCGAYMKNSK